MSFDITFVDGDIAWPLTFSSGDQLLVQRLNTRLSVEYGSWPLDTATGVPWVEWIGTPPDNVVIEDVLRREIESVEGVSRVVTIKSEFDVAAGIYRVTCSVELDNSARVSLGFGLSRSEGVVQLGILPLSP